MFEYLDEFIQDNEDDIIIMEGITEDRIHVLEDKLELELHKEIKEFLLRYGIIMGYGVEILGCGKGSESSLVRETQRFREFGLEKEYVVIRNVDEWIYCLNNKNGKISSWDRNEKKHLLKGDSLEKYILDELMDAKEEWD